MKKKNEIFVEMKKGILLNVEKDSYTGFAKVTFGLFENKNLLKGYEVIDLWSEETELFEKIKPSDFLKEINIKVIYEDIYSTYTKRRKIKAIPEFQLNGNTYKFFTYTEEN